MIFVFKLFLLIPAKFHNALSEEKVREMLSQIITFFFDHAKEQQERFKAGLCLSVILLLLHFLILMYFSILSISKFWFIFSDFCDFYFFYFSLLDFQKLKSFVILFMVDIIRKAYFFMYFSLTDSLIYYFYLTFS